MSDVGATLFSIPPCSPDLNPIKNLFAAVNRQLQADAAEQNITRETFVEFTSSVQRTIEQYSVQAIDKLVSSTNKLISLIIKNKDQRLKY